MLAVGAEVDLICWDHGAISLQTEQQAMSVGDVEIDPIDGAAVLEVQVEHVAFGSQAEAVPAFLTDQLDILERSAGLESGGVEVRFAKRTGHPKVETTAIAPDVVARIAAGMQACWLANETIVAERQKRIVLRMLAVLTEINFIG